MTNPTRTNADMQAPTLSVVMTNYNHSRYIPNALDAILGQSYTPLEIIIIDDASTDESLDILEKYAQKLPLIKLYRNKENMGILYNVNRLLELAKGDYFYSAAADDLIKPGFFKESMDMLSRHPRAGLCSTLSDLIDENGTPCGMVTKTIFTTKSIFVSPRYAKRILQKFGNWIQGNSTIYKKEALIKSGGFNPELHSYGDGFIAQVIALKYGSCFIPATLASWRRMETGYALTQSADFTLRHKIILNISNLMKTQYKELFPQSYIATWKRNELFSILIARINEITSEERQLFTRALTKYGDFLLTDRVLFKLIDFTIALQKSLIKVYVYFRLISLRKFLVKKYNFIKYILKRPLTDR